MPMGFPVTALFASHALLPSGWADAVRLRLAGGRIAEATPGSAPQPGDERLDVLVPAMPNLHSHAFQRGMAGLAEMRGPGADSFWTWRETMYRFALAMRPDQVEAVAAQLYVEMLEAGFGRVGEFHYLHHDRDGRPYADIGEMAARIAAAASATGIGLTLLPVFYAHSGFGGREPAAGQRRFLNDRESFGRLLERSREIVFALPDAVVGVAPHSLRAATPDELDAVARLGAAGPVHIHVAEQVREVEECLAWSGARPVEWLLDHAPVDRRWCFIHATHMTDAEVDRMAASGAVAGLCPVTEANLGDGIFAGARFAAAGGDFGVGSDSNVLIGVADELRQLEYSQRLALRGRTVLAPPNGSNGRALFESALAGGARALGAAPAALAAGAPASFVALRRKTALPRDAVLDAWVFARGAAVDQVWVGGRKLVSDGVHKDRDAILGRFRRTMAELAAA